MKGEKTVENKMIETQELPLWQAPVITELEIKKTMDGLSGINDGTSPTTP